MRVVFREAKKTDLPLIKKLTVETGWKDIPESQRRSLDREEWSRHMVKVFENFANRKDSKIFVAEDEKHAFLGYLFVGESFDMMTGMTYGFIYDIFVTEEYRGKGIGKILIEKAEAYCRERGYPRILLMVSAENQPALRLYAKTGFKTEHMHMGKELGRTQLSSIRCSPSPTMPSRTVQSAKTESHRKNNTANKQNTTRPTGVSAFCQKEASTGVFADEVQKINR